ncbi:MAG: hypothetical protein GY953_39105, partial [bacterium]|nr:hypothetical protein [bacterium]
MTRAILLAGLLCCQTASSQTSSAPPELTTEDVRRFVDPTLMISNIDYSFQSNYLLENVNLYTHTISPFWAVN